MNHDQRPLNSAYFVFNNPVRFFLYLIGAAAGHGPGAVTAARPHALRAYGPVVGRWQVKRGVFERDRHRTFEGETGLLVTV
jgi:hypothetical protein